MALVLGAGAYCEWLAAAEVLTVLGFNEGQARSLASRGQNQEVWDEALPTQQSLLITDSKHLLSLSQTLAKHPHRRVVLLYVNLPFALATMARQPQGSIEQALQDWKQSLSDLQVFYRTHRDQTLLFDMQQVLQYPQQFLEVCAAEWQQAMPSSLPRMQAQSISVDPLLGLLARQLLQEQPDLKQQLQYTQAMTWPLSVEAVTSIEPLSASDLLGYVQEHYGLQQQVQQLELSCADQLLQAQQVQAQLDQLTAANNELKQERELSLEQLLLVQEELERNILSKQALEQEKTQQLAQLTAAKAQSLLDQQATAKKEQEKAQQKINHLTAQKQDLTQQIEQLKSAELQRLAAQTESVNKAEDKSQQKMTELTAQNKELAQENQLLLEQLLLVQEELEQRILAERKASKQLVDLQEMGKENALLLKQLHQSQEMLEGLHQQQAQTVEVETESVAESESTDLVVMSELRIHAPDHTVPPRSFFERRAYKKSQRLARRRDRERAEQIAQSPWFDAAWYLEQYPDVAADPLQSENPALHYMRMGGFEGRNPSPHFDSAFYLASNPDVAHTGLNPLWHFIENGQAEGRQPHP